MRTHFSKGGLRKWVAEKMEMLNAIRNSNK